MALLFDEQFEATGYDETSADAGSDWVEVGNGTIDEDFATSSVTGAPARWGNKCLKLVPGSTGAQTTNTLDTAITGDFYCRVDVIFESVVTGDWNNFFMVRDSSYNDCFRWQHTEAGGTIKLYCYVDAVTPIPAAGYTISLDTVYRLDMYYNATTNAWEVKINGVSQGSNTNATRHVNFAAI